MLAQRKMPDICLFFIFRGFALMRVYFDAWRRAMRARSAAATAQHARWSAAPPCTTQYGKDVFARKERYTGAIKKVKDVR